MPRCGASLRGANVNPIICVVGPTASGKTKLSVALAARYGGEVLSCDSMQIYRGMDIGTAKPTAEEMQGIAHHMIDCIEPGDDFSVSRYMEMADPILQDILRRGKTAVITGGTGQYVDALVAGHGFSPLPATGKREELQRLAEADGIEAVIAILREHDPESAARLHPSDQRRIIRAAEVFLETGKTITQHNLETKSIPPKYRPLWIGLNFEDRQDLYDRIDLRVDLMVKDGLFEEVEKLLGRQLPEGCTALQAIGYKEPILALRGEITRQEAIDRIKQESRRYAKRQLTWFRRNKEIHWLTVPKDPDFTEILSAACRIVEER